REPWSRRRCRAKRSVRLPLSDLGGIPETAAGFARLIPPGIGRDKYLNRFVKETVQVLHKLAGPQNAEAEDYLGRQVNHVNAGSQWALRAWEWDQWLSQARRAVTPCRLP